MKNWLLHVSCQSLKKETKNLVLSVKFNNKAKKGSNKIYTEIRFNLFGWLCCFFNIEKTNAYCFLFQKFVFYYLNLFFPLFVFSILVVHGKQMQALYADYLWLVILQLLLLVKFKKNKKRSGFQAETETTSRCSSCSLHNFVKQCNEIGVKKGRTNNDRRGKRNEGKPTVD